MAHPHSTLNTLRSSKCLRLSKCTAIHVRKGGLGLDSILFWLPSYAIWGAGRPSLSVPPRCLSHSTVEVENSRLWDYPLWSRATKLHLPPRAPVGFEPVVLGKFKLWKRERESVHVCVYIAHECNYALGEKEAVVYVSIFLSGRGRVEEGYI